MRNKQAEIINTLTDKELFFHLFLTQLILLILSLILGFILFDDWASFASIFDFRDIRIFIVGVPAGLAIVAMDLALMKLLPPHYYEDGGINERIFKSLPLPLLFLVPAVVAWCEELLFRGVIQTHSGLILASIIFALVHYRYLFNWFLLINMVFLSFVIGFIYHQTGNLAVTITIHFIIDLLLGLAIKYRPSTSKIHPGKEA
ncbi:lysostaphin resistance A-like protein [Peribacillus sp. SCS-37]|uniref:CPBP family intramembrane glutamic endopeptidase n=1 Tax=Paraperibacillus esterisolvens TaxID=3115296 RepID=UPI00390596CE